MDKNLKVIAAAALALGGGVLLLWSSALPAKGPSFLQEAHDPATKTPGSSDLKTIFNTRYGFSFNPRGLPVHHDTAWIGPTDLSRTWAYVVGDPLDPTNSLQIVVGDPNVALGWDKEIATNWAQDTYTQALERWENLRGSRPTSTGGHQSSTSPGASAAVSKIEALTSQSLPAYGFTVSQALKPSRQYDMTTRHVFLELHDATLYVTLPAGNSLLDAVLESIQSIKLQRELTE